VRDNLTKHRLGNIGTLIRAADSVLAMSGLPFCTPLVEQIMSYVALEITISARNICHGIVIRISTIEYFSTRDGEVRD
jgi:hypothetical protein